MTRHVLVTGGAGYVGAHACKALRRAGYTPVTLDNLATGWRDAVRFGPFEEADLCDRARLAAVFERWKPVAVMHFAALSLVGESMSDPGRYWRTNVEGALNLIEAALAADCKRFIFSSTCATYGDQDGVILTEDTPQRPINAYGGSKRAIEDMLRDFESHGLNSVVFRYFNVAGADPEGEVGEVHTPETHLVPLLLDAIDGRRPGLTLHGTDYPTPDGTCVRDYVHVCDLVDAHLAGLKWLEQGKGSQVFCLGSGQGYSVRQVIAAARTVTNRPVPVTEGPRRPGDAAQLVCGSHKATTLLGWRPQRSDLRTIIADAWRWHQNGGYER
jgi:UDP-glucose 4-epimerase